ncbi:MAG: hypothetical protein KAY32_13945 [Candidatus Eisenbacteria sp.]|nr:hypothetical protein [Candidatus Eisenbacteria bacterium]
MLGLVHFPWRKVIGLALIALLLLPVLEQAAAAPRAKAPAGEVAVIGERAGDLPGALDKNEGGGDDKDTPCVPTDGEGDPDDYGFLPPLIERLLFFLRLIG